MEDMQGKTAVVTGATSGIGREVATALAQRGATVVLACRNLLQAKETANTIRTNHPGAKVEVGPPLDLESLDSIRQFAQEYRREGRPLHLLVNNAGTNSLPEFYTKEGIGGLCQINYLGPYALTRLLEPVLLRSAPARIVSVSSVMHRTGSMGGDLRAWLESWRAGSHYPATKLANVLFAYEAQRRLGPLGVQSCASDPGASWTNIWRRSIWQKPPFHWLLTAVYAPPRDGATSTIHACTVAWPPAHDPAKDLKYYARGLFAAPLLTHGGPGGIFAAGPQPGLSGELRKLVWGLGVALPCSLADWPARWLSKGRWQSRTAAVPSSRQSYNEALAAELWDVSADVVGVPRSVQKT